MSNRTLKVQDGFTLTGRGHYRKPTKAELLRLSQVCAESQRVSDAIRREAGLPPVAPNSFRALLAADVAKRLQ